MKKTLFSILLSTSIIGVNYAQNTNLDRNYVNFQYVNLPSRPIEDSNLTLPIKWFWQDFKRKKIPMMPH